MLDGMKSNVDKVFNEYAQSIKTKISEGVYFDHGDEVEKATQRSKVKLR